MWCKLFSSATFPTSAVMSSNSTAFQSAFLRPGDSYRGKTAASTLSMSVATVAVLVAIENWTKWSLVEPTTEVTCGIDDKLPDQILPGYSEMGLFEKAVSTCPRFFVTEETEDTFIKMPKTVFVDKE